MKQLILNTIKARPTTLSKLEERASSRNIDLDELYAVLEQVHRDRRVKRTVKGDDVVYSWQEPKKKDPTPGLTWVRQHYPWPGKNGVPAFEMPFPEIDMSWMFLRSVEERDAYKAAAAGKPLHMIQSKRGHTRR